MLKSTPVPRSIARPLALLRGLGSGGPYSSHAHEEPGKQGLVPSGMRVWAAGACRGACRPQWWSVLVFLFFSKTPRKHDQSQSWKMFSWSGQAS